MSRPSTSHPSKLLVVKPQELVVLCLQIICLLVFGLSFLGPAKAPTYLFLLSQFAPRMIGSCEAAVCGYLYVFPQSHAGRH